MTNLGLSPDISDHPFDLLIALAESAQQYAIEEVKTKIEEQAQAQKKTASWLGLGFFSSSCRWLVDIADVTEVMLCPVISPIPGVYHWMKGIVQSHGCIIPVTDLEAYWTDRALCIKKETPILVIKHNEELYGFLVEKLYGVMKLDGHIFEKTDKSKNTIDSHGESWSLFLHKALIQAPRFQKIFCE